MEFDIQDKNIILVDDVLYTGRTTRAALDALFDHGRPRRIQLCALIDRGHRELPIEAAFVGRKIETTQDEIVEVKLQETDGIEKVLLVERIHPRAMNRRRSFLTWYRSTYSRTNQFLSQAGAAHGSAQSAAVVARQASRPAVLRGFDAHSHLVRVRSQGARRNHHADHGNLVEHREGRVAHRHWLDDYRPWRRR